MALQVAELSVQLIETLRRARHSRRRRRSALRPLIGRIKARDKSLADQLTDIARGDYIDGAELIAQLRARREATGQ